MAKWRDKLLASREQKKQNDLSTAMGDQLLTRKGEMYDSYYKNQAGYTSLSKKWQDMYKRALDYYNNESHQSFYDTYSGTRNKTGYVADTGDWYSNLETLKTQNNADAEKLLAELDQYSRYYNADAVKYVRDLITKRKSSYDDMMTDAKKFSDHWGQWGTRQDYDNAVWEHDFYSSIQAGDFDAAQTYLNGMYKDVSNLGGEDPAIIEKRTKKLKEYQDYFTQMKEYTAFMEKYSPFMDKYANMSKEDLAAAKDALVIELGKAVNSQPSGADPLGLSKSDTQKIERELEYVNLLIDQQVRSHPAFKFIDLYNKVTGKVDDFVKKSTGIPIDSKQMVSDISEIVSDVKKLNELPEYFQGSALFEDGWQAGDALKTAGATAADLGVNLVKGGFNAVEGLVDLGAYGAAAAVDASGDEEIADAIRRAAIQSQTDQIWGGLHGAVNPYSVLSNQSDEMAQSLAQMYTIGLTAGSAGLGKVGTTILNSLGMGLSTMGGSMGEAYQGDADDWEALAYGAMSGAIEAGSEMIFGGLGKAVNALGYSKGISSLDDTFAKKLSDKISSQFWKNAVQFGVKAGAEGLEEVIAGFGSAVAKKLTYLSEEDLWKLVVDERLLSAFVSGAVMSGFAQSGLIPGTKQGSFIDTTRQGRDFITGLTADGQRFVDTEYAARLSEAEKNGQKLSRRDKLRTYEDVLKSITVDESVQKQFTAQNDTKRQQVTADIEKKISSEISDKQVRAKMAEALTKIAYGENVSNSDLRKISQSKKALKVLEEITGTKHKAGEVTVKELRKEISSKQDNTTRLSSENILATASAFFNMDEVAERSLMVNYAADTRNAEGGKVIAPEEYAALYNAVYVAGKKGNDISKISGELSSVMSESAIAQAYRAGQNAGAAVKSEGSEQSRTAKDELLGSLDIGKLDNNKSYYTLDELGVSKKDQAAWISAGIATERNIRGTTVATVNTTTLKAELKRRENSQKDLSNRTESGKINTKDKEHQNEHERDGVHLRDGSERNRGQDPGGQISAVEGRTRQDQSRKETRGRPRDSEAASLAYGEEVDAKLLGIKGGVEAGKVHLVAEGSEIASMKEARKRAESCGLKVTFFVGGNLRVAQNGKIASVRGYIQGNEIFIRVDHPKYTADQLTRHEICHYMIDRGEIDVNAVRELINERFDKEGRELIAAAYEEAYRGSGLSPEEIWVEIICDSYGDMNAFDSVEALGDINAEFLSVLKEETLNSRKEARGPPKSTEGKASRENSKRRSKVAPMNEFATNAMQWAYSTKTEIGEQKLFYRKGRWVLLEKSDDGFVEMGTYSEIQYDFINKEINRLNEKLHDRGIDERVYRGALRYESLGSDNSWDMRNDVGQQTRNGSAGILHQTESESNRSGDNQESEYDTGHFSREIDAEYISAVKRGDMETAQRMVDEAAKKAGYDRLFYHGAKKGGGFTQFRDWSYFTENKAYAERYADREKSGSLYTVFVKFDKLFDTRKIKEKKLFNEIRQEYGLSEIQDSGLPDWTDGYDIADYIDENDLDYNGIILDEGGDMVDGKPVSRGESYVVRKSAQIKSAAPVTYDDNGNVIPLSERFNNENADIRFSLDLDEMMEETESKSETRELSNREVLADMLERDDMSPSQKGFLTKYKNKIAQIEANEQKIADMTAELDALKKSGKGKSAKAATLENQIRTLEKQNAASESIILNLEATKPIKRLLERERKAAYAEGLLAGQMAQGKDDAPKLRHAEEKNEFLHRRADETLADYKKRAFERENQLKLEAKERMAAQRERAREALEKQAKRYQESRAAGIEGRHKTAVKNKIRNVVAELDKLLRHGNKKSNVKLGLQDAVALSLEAFDINEEKIARYERDMAMLDEKIAAATDPIEIEALTALRDKKKRNSEILADKLLALKKSYEDIHNNAGDENYPAYYRAEAKVIQDRISDVLEKVGNVPISEMSLDQLDAVYDMYRMVLTTVRDANKAFINGQLEDLTENAADMTAELQKIKKLPEERLRAGDNARGFVWNELTPYYAFKRIGSETLMRYYDELVRGQDVYARDLDEAKRFAEKVREKHKADKWNRNKIVTFKDKDGRTFRLNLGHMMSIYAYSKREQALDHMEKGGFFFNNKETFRTKGGVLEFVASNESGYKVNSAVLAKIAATLTSEQRAYVDEMQAYLTAMGEKGNEVSRQMWGIDIFKEKVYFTLKSKEDFIYQANTPAETSSLKNDGMTKETKPHASNPIVLESFDDVWANHVEKMSKYHGFVIPIDNLNKIINYGSWIDGEAQSISTMLEARYSSAVNDYLTTFIKDLNGAKAQNGGLLGWLSNGLTKFKKTAVAASLSVVVQQPTAILRAASEIDPKYFAHLPKVETLNKKWEKIKKYAPVAIIKDIGGFDAGSGRQITEWLNADTRHGVNKAMSKIDDLTMYGAALGDQIGWGSIWTAVEREVQAKQNLKYGTEEFYEACGKRFTDVIVKTQVYDSTLSRSGFMRGKDGLLKMATAFMGEPTLSINMLADTFLQAKRGTIKKRQAVRTVAAVYTATIAASIFKSIIYALRDDDEDESYAEKYLQALGGTVLNDVVNPFNMLPIFRDVVSIFDGWEVERTDMAIVQDLYNATIGLSSENKTTWRKIEDFTGALGALAGVPAKNLLRTAREMYNAINDAFDGIEGGDLGGAFVEGITGKEKSKSQTLYEALIEGDPERIYAIKNDYKTAEAYQTAVRKALREHDPRIQLAAEALMNGDLLTRNTILYDIVSEGVFDESTVLKAIQAEYDKMKTDANASDDVESDTPWYDLEDDDTSVEGSIYSTSDITTAFEYCSDELALEIIAELTELKVAEKIAKAKAAADSKGEKFDEKAARAEAENSVRSTLRSTMTKHYKSLYQAAYKKGDHTEMERIKNILNVSGLYVYKTDRTVDDVLEEWLEEE